MRIGKEIDIEVFSIYHFDDSKKAKQMNSLYEYVKIFSFYNIGGRTIYSSKLNNYWTFLISGQIYIPLI